MYNCWGFWVNGLLKNLVWHPVHYLLESSNRPTVVYSQLGQLVTSPTIPIRLNKKKINKPTAVKLRTVRQKDQENLRPVDGATKILIRPMTSLHST